jgi:hypothetical protein
MRLSFLSCEFVLNWPDFQGLRKSDGAQGKSRTAGRGDCAACRAAGRARGEVELMAVSKTFPAETIAEAAALGLTLFGENRVQEFGGKRRTQLEPGGLSAPVARSSDRPFAIEQGGARGGAF